MSIDMRVSNAGLNYAKLAPGLKNIPVTLAGSKDIIAQKSESGIKRAQAEFNKPLPQSVRAFRAYKIQCENIDKLLAAKKKRFLSGAPTTAELNKNEIAETKKPIEEIEKVLKKHDGKGTLEAFTKERDSRAAASLRRAEAKSQPVSKKINISSRDIGLVEKAAKQNNKYTAQISGDNIWADGKRNQTRMLPATPMFNPFAARNRPVYKPAVSPPNQSHKMQYNKIVPGDWETKKVNVSISPAFSKQSLPAYNAAKRPQTMVRQIPQQMMADFAKIQKDRKVAVNANIASSRRSDAIRTASKYISPMRADSIKMMKNVRFAPRTADQTARISRSNNADNQRRIMQRSVEKSRNKP